MYTIGPGITAAAGTRVALQLHSGVCLEHLRFGRKAMLRADMFRHYLLWSRVDNLRACSYP